MSHSPRKYTHHAAVRRHANDAMCRDLLHEGRLTSTIVTCVGGTGQGLFFFNIIQVLWIVHQQIQHIILMFKFLGKKYIYQTLRRVPGYVGHV